MSDNAKNQMTRKEFEKQIIKKAQADNEFKKALLGNPKETLQTQLGVQVSEEVEVKVVEESSKVVYLVLPVNPDELTDEQLDAVAGGASEEWHCPLDLIKCSDFWFNLFSGKFS